MTDPGRSGENAAGGWRWKAGSGFQRTPRAAAPVAELPHETDPHRRRQAAHELAAEREFYEDQTPGLDELAR